ncbi:MAG: NAD(+) synthase [Acidobacteria bacterium]|nr:MAG: NAD(+) synthase [Acidobacteriota bacterium]PYQ23573.1 MAG: NAD(+) synthase [Acidobacteriota bacterium]
MTTAPYGFLRVAAACPPVTVADPERNVAAILRFVAKARRLGVQVLLFPELALTGYTSGDLFFSLATLVGGAERALARLMRETAKSPMVIVAGVPVALEGKLFNAAAVLQAGRLLGVVPKTYLPGYKEYYEERWFSSSREALAEEVRLAGQTAPFGSRLLFGMEDDPGVTLAVEICEDLWAPVPPSSLHAVAGATVLLCPSASNDLVGKAEYRRELVKVQSGRAVGAYVYANTGVHESTTDVVFGGHLIVAENATLLAESERFRRDGELVVTEVDVERLLVDRVRQTSFAEGVHALPDGYRRVALAAVPASAPFRLIREIEAHPFVPSDPATLEERCQEIFSIQTAGLAKRLEHTRLGRVTLGLSGGLDSTLALLVAARTFDLLGVPRRGVLAVTMPGFGTTSHTLDNARQLAGALGVELREVDIRAACRQHIQDIGLDPDDTRSVTFQNLQARERTQVLMDLANMERALQLGTGDLSELALGYTTFAGDHISMYNVNASVPKTLVRELVRWVAGHETTGPEARVLRSVLDTPVSAELLPPDEDGAISQRTEEIVGPYELHDFFLFCLLRLGAGPAKTLFLAEHAFRGAYEPSTLRRWLRVFVTRFFEQQFKRSISPDGPKVGSVSLSPRGDWRMPSDASSAAWLAELDEPAPVSKTLKTRKSTSRSK